MTLSLGEKQEAGRQPLSEQSPAPQPVVQGWASFPTITVQGQQNSIAWILDTHLDLSFRNDS